MIDLVCGSIVAAAAVLVAAVWAGSPARRSRRIDRIEMAGSSVLLGPGVQRVAYGWLERFGVVLARAGLSANAITLASIPFAAASAFAMAAGHYGVGSLLAAASYACDAFDGMVARATGTVSRSGELLDAICDRVCEALMLGGLAVAWRSSAPLLALVLVAEAGAQQVTLVSAKAEAFPAARGRVPRGLMRRPERAVYFVGASALAGMLLELVPARFDPELVAHVPLVLAMMLIGILGNASAVFRLRSLARTLSGDGVYHAR